MGRAAWGVEAAVVPTAVAAMAAVALVAHLPTALRPTAHQPTGLSQLMVLVTAPLLQATLLQVRAAAWQRMCSVGRWPVLTQCFSAQLSDQMQQHVACNLGPLTTAGAAVVCMGI